MGILNRRNKYLLSAMTVTTFAVGFGLCAHRRNQVYVTKWLGDRRAALSITYDAGYVLGPVNEEIQSLVLRHGLQMDYELVTSDIDKREDQTRHIVEKMLPAGFQFFGHGHQHAPHDFMPYDEAKSSFKRCFETMRALGLEPVAYAYPFGAGHRLETRQALKEAGFLSGRTFNLELQRYALIMPDDELAPNDWFYLPTLVMMDRASDPGFEEAINDTAELIPPLVRALQHRAWVILTYHAIGTDGWGRYSMDTFKSDLLAIKDRGFWVASMNDITLYARERKEAKVDYSWEGEGSESLSFRVEDGLPGEVYSFPLTVSFPLPDAWRGATLAIERTGQPVGILRTLPDQDRALWDVPPDGRRCTVKKIAGLGAERTPPSARFASLLTDPRSSVGAPFFGPSRMSGAAAASGSLQVSPRSRFVFEGDRIGRGG